MANGTTVALPRTIGRRLGSLPIALGAALGFVVAYGLAQAWKVTIGYVLERLAAVSIVGAHPLGFLRTVDSTVQNGLAAIQRYAEKGIVWGFVNFATFWLLIGAAVAAIGYSIFELGGWTETYVTRRLHALRAGASSVDLRKMVAAANAYAREIVHPIDRAISGLRAKVAHLEHLAGVAAHAAGGAIAIPVPRVGAVWKGIDDLGKRVRGLERNFGKVAFAAAVGVALSRLGLGWLKCANSKTWGSKLCRMDKLLFDALAASLVFVVATDGIVAFAEDVQRIVGGAAHLTRSFWGATDVGKGGDRALGAPNVTR